MNFATSREAPFVEGENGENRGKEDLSMFRKKGLASVAVVAALGGFLTGIAPAMATYSINMYDFNLTKGTNVIFDDTFSDGAAPPSAPNFSNGSTAVYGTTGGFVEPVGGPLQLDSANAVNPGFSALGTPFAGNYAILHSNIDPTNLTNGLKEGGSFSVNGLFDLYQPTVPLEHYGIRLTDHVGSGPQAQAGNDVVDLQVGLSGSGTFRVALNQINFDTPSVTTLDTVTLTSALLAGVDRIALHLIVNAANQTAVAASFDLLSGSTVLNTIALANTGTIFSDENWTRAEFYAATPVPEPATVALFGLGLAVAGFARRRRRTA